MPPGLERVLRRCLEKQADDRFQSAKDLAFALENLAGAGPSATREVSVPPPEAPATAGRRARWKVAMATSVVLAALAGYLGGRWRRPESPPAPVRLFLTASEGRKLNNQGDCFAVSPDGRFVALSESSGTNSRLSVRSLGSLDARPLLTMPRSPKNLFWSPDGRFIGFFDSQNLQTLSVEGLDPDRLEVRGAAFVVSRDGGALPVWSGTGERLFFLSPDAELMAVGLHLEGADLKAEPPQRSFDVPKSSLNYGFDVSPDGQSFLLGVIVPDPRMDLLTVVLNGLPGGRR